VDTIFGYPGGTVLFIYDELFKQKDRIRHVLTSHEQHAAHAADGYARASGKVGVCLATSGPGATNLVTGIATAYMDSIPMVAITGNVATNLLGKDSFQEIDIAGVTMPIVKHNWIVKDVRDLAEVVREAFVVAVSGRPGPVLIDIPKDVTAEIADWEPLDSAHRSPADVTARDLAIAAPAAAARAARLAARTSAASFTAADIDEAVRLLSSAKRPFLYSGGGVIISDACSQLRELAERLSAPVAMSLMGLGSLPSDHPLCTGMIGMHGTKASNMAVQRADLVVAIGARFSDRVTSKADTFAPNADILHLDIDPAEINKNIKSEHWVVGDLKLTLGAILARLPPRVPTEWNGEIAEWRKQIPLAHSRDVPLHPRFLMEEVSRALGGEAIIATDVGQHQMWTAQFYPFTRPRSFVSSGGLGTMGFGAGAALGAAISQPGRKAVLFTGDGSFRMNCGELATMSNYHVPVLVIVVNNGVLGMVRQWQALFYDERYAETTLTRPPDFVKLAEAYSLPAWLAKDEASFRTALSAALKVIESGKPALIEARIDMDQQVLPMVPGGKAIDEQFM
ncbi:MAG: acetolactate synthase, large subunit, biosynthetic type, partial [Treponema sp. GWB1_62_6]